MAEEVDFAKAGSGASTTFPQQCSALRKNGFVVLKNRPCKIVEMSTSKTGKHGHAKVHLVGLDVFTGKKFEDICPSTHNMNVPNVYRREYTIICCNDDGYFTLLDDQGATREDLRFTSHCNVDTPEAVQAMIENANDCDQSVMASVWSAMGEEIIKEIKLGK